MPNHFVPSGVIFKEILSDLEIVYEGYRSGALCEKARESNWHLDEDGRWKIKDKAEAKRQSEQEVAYLRSKKQPA